MHSNHISEVLPFKIISEGSVAAGTRRIEAVAGRIGVDWYKSEYNTIDDVAKSLGVNVSKLPTKINKLVSSEKDLQNKLNNLQKYLMDTPSIPIKSGKIILKDSKKVSLEARQVK